MLERTRPGAIFGESMVEMGAPYSLKGLLGNPICSPEYWKPSTFGGKVGFDIVNSATLKNLVCQNIKTCPYVAFSVPKEAQSQRSGSKGRTDELWLPTKPREQNTELCCQKNKEQINEGWVFLMLSFCKFGFFCAWDFKMWNEEFAVCIPFSYSFFTIAIFVFMFRFDLIMYYSCTIFFSLLINV